MAWLGQATRSPSTHLRQAAPTWAESSTLQATALACPETLSLARLRLRNQTSNDRVKDAGLQLPRRQGGVADLARPSVHLASDPSEWLGRRCASDFKSGSIRKEPEIRQVLFRQLLPSREWISTYK